MSNELAGLIFRKRRRHYVLRPENAAHWFAVARQKLARFEKHFGHDFCLVLVTAEDPDRLYVIPFGLISGLFQRGRTGRSRWDFTIAGELLKMTRCVRTVPLSPFRNALGLLDIVEGNAA